MEWKPVDLFCNENVKVSKKLLKKLKIFTKENYEFRFMKQRKSGSFSLFERACETKRNVAAGPNKNENPNKDSESEFSF